MEKLTIKTPEDFISLMGHSLGFWPTESLVCVTLDGQQIGATLRVDLPQPGADLDRYVSLACRYIENDPAATGVVLGIFTDAAWPEGSPRPFDPVISKLTETLVERNISVRDGWFVRHDSFCPNTSSTQPTPSFPLERVTSSTLNAELIFRGSSVQSTEDLHIPVIAHGDLSSQVALNCTLIERMQPAKAIRAARTLWRSALEGPDMPSDEHCAELIAYLKFVSVRDRLLADIPGLDAPMSDLLLGQTTTPPRWSRVDRAEQVLLHLYARSDRQDVAPIITSIGIIQWWEGHASKAHKCFEHALEADPRYRLAQLTDQLLNAGIVSDWATNKQTAYQPPYTRGLGIAGMDLS